MIRRILLLKFVSWVVLSPVLALAPTLRFSGVPHPSYPLRTWRLGLHVGSQDGVDAGMVAASGLLESFDNVMVNPDGQAVFGFRHGELGGLPERFIQLEISESSMSASRIRRKRLKSVLPLVRDLEVVHVILPFIAMCSPG
jgi:hypothetical protein